MSQVSDVSLANQGFSAFRTELNNILGALNTLHLGSSAPASLAAGSLWVDTSGGVTAYLLKFYDGSDHITFATINTTANTVNWTDSSVSFDIVNDVSPQLGGMLDVNGQSLGDGTLELLKFSETGSAVNEFTIANAAAGNGPTLSSTGTETNVDINITPKGTGDVVLAADTTKVGDSGAAATLMSNGAGTLTVTTGGTTDLILSTNNGTNSGTITITDAANGDINIAPNGSGTVQAGGTAIKVAGKETIWVPSAAITPTASNGCAARTQVETTSGRPDLDVLDFDDGSDEHAQFSVAFPKSWNKGTVTFQVFWTSTATDTDGVSWALQGVAVSDNETIDVAYGTAIVVDDACQSAAEELYVAPESSALTIASSGSIADGDLCYFRIFRDVSDSNDDAAEDARLIGVKIFYTTDAKNDA